MLKDRRLGRFFVAEAFLASDNEVLRRLMAKIIVLKADYDYMRDGFAYVAVCEEFEECPPHLEVPEYSVVCSGNPIKVSFQKGPYWARSSDPTDGRHE